MTREAESMTDAEKLACFERVLEILRDRRSLEIHMRGRNATFQEILYAREDAYCNIVNAVYGPSGVYEMENPGRAAARQRARSKASNEKKSSAKPSPES